MVHYNLRNLLFRNSKSKPLVLKKGKRLVQAKISYLVVNILQLKTTFSYTLQNIENVNNLKKERDNKNCILFVI